MEEKMEKNNKWILGGGAVIALLAILLILPPPRKTDVDHAPKNDGPTLVTERFTESKDEPRYSVDAEYPRIDGLANKNVETSVNQELKSVVEKNAKDFRTGLAETTFTYEEKERESKLQMRFEKGYANENLLSIAMESYWDVVGAAHPSVDTLTYTYDLRYGKKLALKDLFLPGSEYLKAISDRAMADLERQLGDDPNAVERIAEGAGPDERNYENFLIAPQGLVIIFNPYQVAPGAGGTLRAVVPYAVLDLFVDPVGVLPQRS